MPMWLFLQVVNVTWETESWHELKMWPVWAICLDCLKAAWKVWDRIRGELTAGRVWTSHSSTYKTNLLSGWLLSQLTWGSWGWVCTEESWLTDLTGPADSWCFVSAGRDLILGSAERGAVASCLRPPFSNSEVREENVGWKVINVR